jgi:hypothetical protein
MRATFLVYNVLLDFKTFDEDYKECTPLLCHFLHRFRSSYAVSGSDNLFVQL